MHLRLTVLVRLRVQMAHSQDVVLGAVLLLARVALVHSEEEEEEEGLPQASGVQVARAAAVVAVVARNQPLNLPAERVAQGIAVSCP